MKKYLPFVLIAILSSLCAVGIYRIFEKPLLVDWGTQAAGVHFAGYSEDRHRLNMLAGGATSATEFTTAAALVTPSVVNIRTLEVTDPGFWGGGTIKGNTGSGVIVSADGYIVTNSHVIENSSDIKITLADKRQYKGKIVGRDPSTDIAVLKIEAINLPYILFGNSDSVQVGEWVLAVGNPFNLASTVTAGIVSAKSRNINILGGQSSKSIESFIQTDAAVNPGNSGGALVNTQGDLIGINTAILTESGNYEGYSFAVPSNLVQKVVRDLREFGEVKRGFLGIGIEDVGPESADEAGLVNVNGVLVNRVNINSGASDAGLQEGDIILAINDNKVNGTSELQELVGRFRPGDRLKIDYWRAEQTRQVMIELKDQNNNRVIAAVDTYNQDALYADYGITFRPLNSSEKRRYNLSGLTVISVNRESIIGETQMQAGFVINSINGTTVLTAEEAVQVIRAARNSVSIDGFYPGEPDLYSYRFKQPG
jgi:serine protease Do